MPEIKKSFQIEKRNFFHAGEASIKIKNLLKSIAVHPDLIRRIAICGYEGEMNAVMHGGDGLLTIEIDADEIALEISDDGAGIENIELAMTKGFSTAPDEYREMGFGAGMGLPNMKKNADGFSIESEKGKGARVRMTFTPPERRGAD